LLLVDDDPLIALVVERLGRRAEQDVAIRVDVASAWHYLGKERPDLVILDIYLPGESGVELCRRIRTTPPLADLQVALFSHTERPADILAGLRAGADAVLSKDLVGRPRDWQSRLQELLAPAENRPYQRLLRKTPLPLLLTPSVQDWHETIAQRLRHPILGRLDPEIIPFLAERAARQVGPEFPAGALTPEGLGFDLNHTALAQRPELVVRFTVALAEQVGCVLGGAACASLLAVLVAACPSLADCWTHE
jgi:CheY-like chemotaxis protein